MTEISKHSSGHGHEGQIHIPANTAWPLVLAFGLTLSFGGILLGIWITVLGLLLCLISIIGWFRDVLPHESAEYVSVEVRPFVSETTRKVVDRIELPLLEHKPGELLPQATLIAGLKGGIFGGVAMAVVVMIYGQLIHGSVWYGVNLLGGAGVADWTNATTAQIAEFHWGWFLIALLIHSTASILMGLIYGAMLPMLPSRPMLLSGIAAPLIWSGLLYAGMGIINPAMNSRISWPWFLVSQLVFGLVAGWVVAHDENFKRIRKMPLAIRVGLEVPGLIQENHQGESH